MPNRLSRQERYPTEREAREPLTKPNYDISETNTLLVNTDTEFDVINSFYILSENEIITGYILSITANGYGGPMDMIVGYEKNGKLIQARLLKNTETPGLGKEAEKPEYMEMFLSKGASSPIPLRKNQLPAEHADAISGATITFFGAAKALFLGSEFVKTQLAESKQ